MHLNLDQIKLIQLELEFQKTNLDLESIKEIIDTSLKDLNESSSTMPLLSLVPSTEEY